MENWITVREAASFLGVTPQRIYALIAVGTLSSRKQGLVTLVNRRSAEVYKESPTRNKFAGGHLKPIDDDQQPRLDLDSHGAELAGIRSGFGGAL